MFKRLFLLSAICAFSAAVARADDQAKARAILDQGIKAHGGAAALGKFVACSFKMVHNDLVDDMKHSENYEIYAQGDDKMRSVTFRNGSTTPSTIQVINGRQSWDKEGSQEAEEGETPDPQLDEVYLNWATMLVPLTKEGVHLSTVKDATVSGRKAVGILVKADKHQPFKFYFDAKMHLLVMCEMASSEDEFQGDVKQLVWSDFQEVQGTKQPMQMSEIWDTVEISSSKITGLKFYEKPLDAKLFEKP